MQDQTIDPADVLAGHLERLRADAGRILDQLQPLNETRTNLMSRLAAIDAAIDKSERSLRLMRGEPPHGVLLADGDVVKTAAAEDPAEDPDEDLEEDLDEEEDMVELVGPASSPASVADVVTAASHALAEDHAFADELRQADDLIDEVESELAAPDPAPGDWRDWDPAAFSPATLRPLGFVEVRLRDGTLHSEHADTLHWGNLPAAADFEIVAWRHAGGASRAVLAGPVEISTNYSRLFMGGKS